MTLRPNIQRSFSGCGFFRTGIPVVGFLLLCLVCSLPSCRKSEIQSLDDRLEVLIGDKQKYDELKEARIARLQCQLDVAGLTSEQEYSINSQLQREYGKYKIDSAVRYAERNLSIARRLCDCSKISVSTLGLARLYSFLGMSVEAGELLRSISPERLSDAERGLYYDTYSEFYNHYATLSGQKRYWQDMHRYRDTMLMVADTGNYRYKVLLGYELIDRGDTSSAERMLLALLARLEKDSPEYAEGAYALGSLYAAKGDAELERMYFTYSAIADLKNAIKENNSFLALANCYYERNDLSRALLYTQSAIDDALFCNILFRTAHISKYYSIINASYQAREVRSKSKLERYLLLISLLSFVLVLLFAYAYSQMRKFSRIKEEFSRTNAKLEQLNDELNGKNELLADSNLVKVQYIARFFDLCSMYIDKMDDYRRSLKKLAQDRQFEALYLRLKSTSMLEGEQAELYKNFDTIFLSLYPSFVEDFNALLIPDERIVLRSGDLLNKELRIYALMRLGITDSSKIALFLRCSLSTVYNYRTKVRNKSLISREAFEERVLRIGIVHNKLL